MCDKNRYNILTLPWCRVSIKVQCIINTYTSICKSIICYHVLACAHNIHGIFTPHIQIIVMKANLSKATVASNTFVCLSVTRNNNTQCTSTVMNKPKHTVMGIDCSQHDVYTWNSYAWSYKYGTYAPQTFIHNRVHSLWTLIAMKIVANRHNVYT